MSRLVDFWNEGAAQCLARALEENGVRVEDLAERLDVTPRAVRNWMRTDVRPSRPGVKSLGEFCVELRVPLNEFRMAAEAYNARLAALPAASPGEGRRSVRVYRYAPLMAGALTLLIGGMAATWLAARHANPSQAPLVTSPAVTFEIPPELPGVYDRAFWGDVSPDGTQIAFLARSVRTRRRMLFVHSIADRLTRPLPSSEGDYTSFFWDTDSGSIFFVTKADLMKISLAGGTPRRVAEIGDALRGTVNRDGVIVLGSSKGLVRLTGTRKPELLTRVAPGEVAHSLPFFLPDGERVLFSITARNDNQPIRRYLAVASLRSRSMQRLFALPTRAQYANGHLLYVDGGALVARLFDSNALAFAGPKVQLASPVWSDVVTGEAGFSASASTLVVTPSLEIPPLLRVSREGKIHSVISEPQDIRYVAVGRTSEQLALAARGDDPAAVNLWLHPLDSRQSVTLVADGDQPSCPLFSPDDRLVYYASTGTSFGNIFAIDVRQDDKPTPVLVSNDITSPRDISPDGKFLLFQRWLNRDGNLWYMPLGQPDKARPLVATSEEEGESARFSPDGRQVAFVAKRGSEYSIYVVDFPSRARLARQAIEGDGWRARWSHDGRHIYFARGKGVFEADPATRKTRHLFDMKRDITILEVARSGGFYIRESAREPNRVVATLWWRLTDRPLSLARAR